MLRFLSKRGHAVSIGYFTKNIWPTLSTTEKKQIALNESDPQDAEVSYYKGLALSEMGKEFFGEALYAFRKASELDNNFSKLASREIASIYYEQGDYSLAYNELKKICDTLFSQPPNLTNSGNYNSTPDGVSHTGRSPHFTGWDAT